MIYNKTKTCNQYEQIAVGSIIKHITEDNVSFVGDLKVQTRPYDTVFKMSIPVYIV